MDRCKNLRQMGCIGLCQVLINFISWDGKPTNFARQGGKLKAAFGTKFLTSLKRGYAITIFFMKTQCKIPSEEYERKLLLGSSTSVQKRTAFPLSVLFFLLLEPENSFI